MDSLQEQFSEFGTKLRQTDFVLEEGYTFINHGYVGAVPKTVIAAEQRFKDETRRQPANYFLRKQLSTWIKGRDSVADFLNADPKDVVLVPNVTTGISSILMSIPFKTADTILLTNQAYPCINNACSQTLHHNKGVKTKVVNIDVPIQDNAQVVNLYQEALDNDPSVRVVVMEYIPCPCTVQLPVEEIIQLCQKRNVITVIDGAHAPGHIQLNLDKMEADFFTANFYKWMFVPWGCGFVWKNKKVTFPLRCLTSSSPNDDMVSQFCLQGFKEDSSISTLPTAVEYIQIKGGLERISAYNTRLLQMASDHLISLWNTSKLPIPSSMEPPFLRMIRLPEVPGFGTSQEDANSLMDLMYDNYHIDVSLKSVNNQLYVRLSVQIYNCLDDYKKFGEAVMSLAEKGKIRNSEC
ncbi:L-cysteine desulfhydrase-like isoform X1 [Mizuhopecten yessoensis]|uniref:L-cysteine desulfhydrase-like isoform X1 n=1 Tax=Mizuhopecten yessoensis TaxID=6573 RepID=UPI000B4583CA|nr:L-cysteine desulfhydrase-like isoform X1 [Mizuhopecten yessoensis]